MSPIIRTKVQNRGICKWYINVPVNLHLIKEISTNLFLASGLILATYCVKYSHAMPFLRNKMPYWLLKPSKANAIRRVLCFKCPNFGKVRGKFHNCALFIRRFCPYTAHSAGMSFFSRISPVHIYHWLWTAPCPMRTKIKSGFDNYHKIAVRDHVRLPKFWRMWRTRQIQESIYQTSYLLASDFPINFS